MQSVNHCLAVDKEKDFTEKNGMDERHLLNNSENMV